MSHSRDDDAPADRRGAGIPAGEPRRGVAPSGPQRPRPASDPFVSSDQVWLDDESERPAPAARERAPEEAPKLELDLPRRPARPATGSSRPSSSFATARRPGDPKTRGPLPDLGPLLEGLLAPVVVAVITAGILGVVASRFLSAGWSAGEDGAAIGLGVGLATVGAHPLIAVFWGVALVGGLVIATAAERVARSVWAAGVVAALVLAGVFAGGSAVGLDTLARDLGFGVVDPRLVQYAVSNLPDYAWATGIALGVGYVAARREDDLLGLAALGAAAFVAWRIDAARSAAWGHAVVGTAQAMSGGAPDAERNFLFAAYAIRARALVDLYLVASPMMLVRAATRRGAGAAAVSRY